MRGADGPQSQPATAQEAQDEVARQVARGIGGNLGWPGSLKAESGIARLRHYSRQTSGGDAAAHFRRKALLAPVLPEPALKLLPHDGADQAQAKPRSTRRRGRNAALAP